MGKLLHLTVLECVMSRAALFSTVGCIRRCGKRLKDPSFS